MHRTLSDYIKNVLLTEDDSPSSISAVVEESITEPIGTTFAPTTPDEIQRMHDSGLDALYLTRTYKETPKEVVLRALEEAPDALKTHALVHKNCPVEELVRAADNPIHHGAVSINPRTPGNVLEQLSKSPYEHVLMNVASNKNTPKIVLHEMARKFKGHAIGEIASKMMGKK